MHRGGLKKWQDHRPDLVAAAVRRGAIFVGCALFACGPHAPARAARDWVAHPAIHERDAPDVLYAMSDIHGGYRRMATLLAAAKVIDHAPDTPFSVKWTGGISVLLVVGDLIDKGPQSIEVIDFLRALETDAPNSGGAVIVTLGNHEAEFFADYSNAKATKSDGIDTELDTLGIAAVDVASGAEPRGRWLLDRPFGARVGGWFFAHAGNTKGRTVTQLSDALRAPVDANAWGSDELVGPTSLLEARNWYSLDTTIGARYASAVGAKHIVFGHDPNAIGPKGSIAVGQEGALFRIDCGMSPDVDYSQGCLFRVRRAGSEDIAESLAPDGTVTESWRGPHN